MTQETLQLSLPSLNDVWMDNGVETLYRILEEAEDASFTVQLLDNSLIIAIKDFGKFKKAIGIAIKNRRSNLIIKDKDKKLGEVRQVKKDYILIQEGTKIEGKVAFKEEIYNEETTADTVSKIFDFVNGKGKSNCVVCGRPFAKPVKKLQQASYPFVTKVKSLSGVRSYKDGEVYSLKEYFEDFCPSCYLRGILEWTDDAAIYRTVPGEGSMLLLPQMNNLEELATFKKSYRCLLNKNARYRNIRVKEGTEETENTAGTFSTLLCFYEKFFFEISRKGVVGNSWGVIEIPFGAVKNIKFYSLNLKDATLQVIKDLSDEAVGLYSGVIASTFFFNDNPKGSPIDWTLTAETRENLSESLLKDDFYSFAKNLLPQKGRHLGFYKDTMEYLEKLIYLWRLKKMGLDEKDLSTLKSAGKTIAAVSKDHQTLLYRLDKAKDKTTLLNALRQVSRRIAGLKPEEKKEKNAFLYPPALEETVMMLEKHESEKNFIEDMKNTLVIFSCVELSRLNYMSEKQGGIKNE